MCFNVRKNTLIFLGGLKKIVESEKAFDSSFSCVWSDTRFVTDIQPKKAISSITCRDDSEIAIFAQPQNVFIPILEIDDGKEINPNDVQ